MLHVCWSRPTTEPVTSTEYMAVIKSLHCLPPPPSVFLLLAIYMWWGVWGTEWGVKRVCSVDEADCLCVRGRGVSGGGEGGCLFEDSARSLRLVSPAWLFEAVRWPHRATSPQVVVGWGDLLVLLLVVGRYGSLSFVYSCFFHLVQLPSSSPCSSVSSSTLSSCIPLLLLLCSISKTPSSSLKESCVGAGHTGRQPGEPKEVARSGNNRERHQYNGYH